MQHGPWPGIAMHCYAWLCMAMHGCAWLCDIALRSSAMHDKLMQTECLDLRRAARRPKVAPTRGRGRTVRRASRLAFDRRAPMGHAVRTPPQRPRATPRWPSHHASARRRDTAPKCPAHCDAQTWALPMTSFQHVRPAAGTARQRVA